MKKYLTLTLLFISTATFAMDEAKKDHLNDGHAARADIIDNKGQRIGTVDILQGPEGAVLTTDIIALPPGVHGFHIHHTGDCDDHDHFKNAGGHVSEGGKEHGLLNPNGPELGDLPNLIVGDETRANVELYAPGIFISTGDHALLDDDGSAFMIHENADDHMTQPIGGAGARIACGVIEKNEN